MDRNLLFGFLVFVLSSVSYANPQSLELSFYDDDFANLSFVIMGDGEKGVVESRLVKHRSENLFRPPLSPKKKELTPAELARIFDAISKTDLKTAEKRVSKCRSCGAGDSCEYTQLHYAVAGKTRAHWERLIEGPSTSPTASLHTLFGLIKDLLYPPE